jgi:SSS family solute:Na+ symporter
VRLRFGRQVHFVTTIITVYILFMLLFYLLIGLGWGLNPIFGIPYWQGVLIGGLIVIVYTTLGGLWSSIITDYFQFFILWVVVALAIFFGVSKIGGMGQLYRDLSSMGIEKGFALSTMHSFVNYFLIILFSWITYAILDQTLWQRVYAIEREQDVKKTLFTAWVGWSLLPMAAGILGLIGLQQGLELKVASDVIPRVISLLTPAWVGVLWAILVFNAIASTMGSILVAISSIITVDVYEGWIAKGKKVEDSKRLGLTWKLVVIVGIAAIVVSIRPTSIMFLGFYLSGLLLSVTLPIAAGLLVPRSNLQSIRVAMIIGFIIALIFSAAVNYGWITRIGSLTIKLWGVYAFILVLQVLIVVIVSRVKPGPEMTIADVGKKAAEESTASA